MINRIKELTELLNNARNEYYNNSNSPMSDYEYDELFDELKKMESETNFKLANSPTMTVGFDESMDMCLDAEESGTKTLFLTPHLMYWETAENLYDKRERKFEVLGEVLEEEDIPLRIEKGFEILCDDDIFDIKYDDESGEKN